MDQTAFVCYKLLIHISISENLLNNIHFLNLVWNKVPHDIDILSTHGPPKGVLDDNFGCEELAQALTRNKLLPFNRE